MTAPAPAPRWPVRVLHGLLLVSAAWFAWCFLHDSRDELLFNPVHYFDDAYMFIRYARLWHLGYGEAWNIGEHPVYGNTSQLHFLFVLLLTSFPAMTDDLVVKWSSYVPSFVLMAWLPWFAVRHSPLFAAQPRALRYALWAGLLCPAVYWNTPYAYHFLTGMDTALSALLQLWVIDAVLTFSKKITVANSDTIQPVAVILLIYLAYATRPENLLACGLFSTAWFWFVRSQHRIAITIAAGVALLVVADTVAKYLYFGDALPLAFYTKNSGFFDGFAGRFHNHPFFPVFSCLIGIWPFLAVVIFAAQKRDLPAMAAFVLPVLCTVAYFFTMLNIMNEKARYEFPFFFYFIALAVLLAHRIDFRRQAWRRLAASAFLALLLLQGFRYGDSQTGNIVRYLVERQGDPGLCSSPVLDDPPEFPTPVVYSWKDKIFQITEVFTHAPPGVSVVTTEHGYFGVKNLNVRIIDVAGLHNPDIAHHGFSAAWLYAQKPDVIWLPHWHYTCLNHRLLYNDEFIAHYRLFPGLFNLGIALRTDSPHFDTLFHLVDDEVRAKYPGHSLVDFERRVQDYPVPGSPAPERPAP